MANVRVQVEIFSEGVSALMCSPGIVAKTNEAARRIAKTAGSQYFYAKSAQIIGDRPMAFVKPVGNKGRLVEAREKRLLKAVTSCKSSAR